MNVDDIRKLFLQELSEKYPENEIKSIFYYSAHTVLGFSRIDMAFRKDEEISNENQSLFFDILKKLKLDIPIQYILGTSEFYGLPFNVNKNVLIPRPETEELVDWIIKYNKNKNAAIIDIGTGSGCIAISLKKNIPESFVKAVDISEEALTVAIQNAKLNNVIIDFSKLDILNFPDNNSFPEFDIIVSNPPYVRDSEKKLMQNNVLNFEPHKALFVSDNDPLLFYEAIAEFSLKHLKKNGCLYFEINENFSVVLSEMLIRKGYYNVIVKKDINNKNRMIKCSNCL